MKLAIESQVAAATIVSKASSPKTKNNDDLLRIAFDGDAVIFSDESEQILSLIHISEPTRPY